MGIVTEVKGQVGKPKSRKSGFDVAWFNRENKKEKAFGGKAFSCVSLGWVNTADLSSSCR
jgi:hypothetical protein